MKLKNFKYIACAAVLGLSLTSCEDFLNRPVEDSYNTDNYYASDAACISGVNYLYNSPWYDFQRGFIKMGEVMSGNMYWGNSPYMNYSVNGTDEDLVNMAYSLWAEIAHCSTVYSSLAGANASPEVIAQCQGECLTWKAMAYFYLVRSFGDVPIVHDNSSMLSSGSYKTAQKVEKADVYEYIIMTLEKALELMPKVTRTDGHLDYFCAKALLAKVYLTKAGVTGTLNQADLENASRIAGEILDDKDNFKRELMPNYEDIFRGHNNISEESLIAWRWAPYRDPWTSQNSLQSDLGINGFDEYGDVWGQWGGPSVDLINAFGVDPTDDPNSRIDIDVRRKATCMLAGDQYEYFWRDKVSPKGYHGFDYIEAIYDTETEYGKAFSEGKLCGPCGSNNVKHLYGDEADHKAEMGSSAANMTSGLATHILRLSDLYLVYVEAMVLQGKGTDPRARELFFKVRHRGVPSYNKIPDQVTFEDVWKERRLEFAGEGDRWYDYVRRSYYDMNACIAELKAQKRGQYNRTVESSSTGSGLDDVYRTWEQSGRSHWDVSTVEYKEANIDETTGESTLNITAESFTIPFPTEDCALNPNLKREAQPIHVDVRKEYPY